MARRKRPEGEKFQFKHRMDRLESIDFTAVAARVNAQRLANLQTECQQKGKPTPDRLPPDRSANGRRMFQVLRFLHLAIWGVQDKEPQRTNWFGCMADIAAEIQGITERTVRRAVKDLKDAGLVERTPPRYGGEGSGNFEIQWQRVTDLATAQGIQPSLDFPENEQDSAPGQSGKAPGQSGKAPGQNGKAPGQNGKAPGQNGRAIITRARGSFVSNPSKTTSASTSASIPAQSSESLAVPDEWREAEEALVRHLGDWRQAAQSAAEHRLTADEILAIVDLYERAGKLGNKPGRLYHRIVNGRPGQDLLDGWPISRSEIQRALESRAVEVSTTDCGLTSRLWAKFAAMTLAQRDELAAECFADQPELHKTYRRNRVDPYTASKPVAAALLELLRTRHATTPEKSPCP